MVRANYWMLMCTVAALVDCSAGKEEAKKLIVDANGYVMFCPCMGRFGNQADQYLGALAFAKALNRTLVLPPLIEYRRGHPGSEQVPFETYFEVETVNKYNKVVTMEDFFASETWSEKVWPPHRRISFCYSKRQPSPNEPNSGNGGACYAKSGNPFGPFWNKFGVDFFGSETYGPKLHHDVHRTNMAKDWSERYAAGDNGWPVLAFTGAPASYPVQKENVGIHKHLFNWNEKMRSGALRFINDQMPNGAFVGVHLRNGVDWSRACDHIPESPIMFASAQCVGYRNEHGPATMQMCLPPTDEIVRQLRTIVKSTRANWIFVASDNDHMRKELESELKLKVVTLSEDDPHLDLAILARSNHFIGNCISSFSSFVKRERDVRGLPSTFFGFPSPQKDEL